MNWLLIGVGIVFLICMIVGYTKGFIKIVVSLAVMVGTIVFVTAAMPYVSETLKEYTPIDEMIRKECAVMMNIPEGAEGIEIPRRMQVEIMEAADLPLFLKKGLIENNNSEAYARLKVEKFQDYAAVYITDVIVKMVAFLLTFIIVTILARAIVFALDIVTALPILNGMNRLAGIAIGVVIAVIIVWIGFFVVTLMYNTSVGKECFVWIGESPFLTFLYEKNVIIKYVTKLY